MDLNEVKEFLGNDWHEVEAQIRSSLRSDISHLDKTNSFILCHSGKQLRPVLSLLIARACSGGTLTESSYRYAAASELLHDATLLHDDVADNSDQRRGVPTIKSLMGPTVSVLVGDFWLVKAMERILGDRYDEDDDRVTRIFSRTLSNLAEGEMLQLEKAENGDTDYDAYRRIIYCKTASLFEASALSAAISVKAPEEVEVAVGKYAVAVGMAFQIRDDILDYSVSSMVGKPVGVDILEQKITLPLLGALSGVSPEKAAEIRGMVRTIGEHPGHRDTIVDFVKENRGLEYAQRHLAGYVEEAVGCLDVLEDTPEKEYLKKLAYFVGQRVS